MPSIAGQLEGPVKDDRILTQGPLTSGETDVQASEELPPPYDQGPLILYQVIIRPAAQLPEGCPYGDWRNERGPKFSILAMLKEAMTFIGADWDYVQDLDDNDGFCFALGSSWGPPFQTPGWQSMVEVRQLNEEQDTWDIVTPFEESRLVKEVKARFMNRSANSNTGIIDIAPPANLPGDGSNGKLASNGEQGVTERTSKGAAPLLDEASDISLEEVGLGIKTSHGCHWGSS